MLRRIRLIFLISLQFVVALTHPMLADGIVSEESAGKSNQLFAVGDETRTTSFELSGKSPTDFEMLLKFHFLTYSYFIAVVSYVRLWHR